MKIIDLLNKIANGEEAPKKIKYYDDIYEYYNGDYKKDVGDYDSDWLFEIIDLTNLNDEVEIEEDKKIEPLKTLRHSCNFDRHEETLYENEVDLARKITELIDEVNKLKEGKE